MRTGGLLTVGLFVVLATVTACNSATSAGSGAALITGSAPNPASSAVPSESVAVTPTGPLVGPPTIAKPPTVLPVPSQPRGNVPASQVDSSAMVNPPRNVQVSSDGRYVVFIAEQSGCQQITAQATSQTAAQVIIQVITTNTSKGNQMCPMIVREVTVVAQLNAPLNGRTVVFQGVMKHS